MKAYRYNASIDRLASVCPDCEAARVKIDILSPEELEEYATHLLIKHGMSK